MGATACDRRHDCDRRRPQGDLDRHVAERLAVEVDPGRGGSLDPDRAGMDDLDLRVLQVLAW